MKDYKDTLNLPQTGFPMKANLATREPEFLDHWNKINLYQKRNELCKNREKSILHDGPPYANGKLHCGHALNKILKDIVIKAKILNGKASAYVPGWDCHGLPIEVNVEKEFGKPGVKLSKNEFIKKCREFAAKQVEIQKAGFIRLGVIGDWDNPYISMNYSFEANVVRALGKIIENGHLVHGFKPVHWCTACGSALAEAEVEYKNKTSPAIDVRFSVVNKDDFFKRCDLQISDDLEINIPIWTTTPWTLPANQAVALNSEFNYALIKTDKEYLLIAEDLINDVVKRYQLDKYEIIAHIRGNKLDKLKLQHPFLKREVPVILGEHVTIDAGTGAVHTAPGHGQEDYVIGSQYGLPIDNPVGADGCFLPNTEYFAGEHVLKANDHVIEILKEKNKLIHLETIEHSYPHCWRHKTPLIFRATPQWFISMDKNGLRRAALTEINNVNWVPNWGKTAIKAMVSERPDWCISRQRTWGTPIPLFIHKISGELHPDTLKLIEIVAQKIEQEGIEAWINLEAKELIGDDAKDYEKVTDILDVWFDSGVTHACVLKQRPELSWPAYLYLEGADQHRGWFQSSLLTAVAIYGHAPYQTVLTHGHVVDDHGRKMSKSLGNVIDPEKIIKTYGADILRLWVASTDYSAEISYSEESIKRTADAYRRIRNTARFLLANLHDFNYEKNAIENSEMLALDRWLVDSARLLQEDIITAYDKFQFHLIYQKAHNFCTVEMGSFYLDIIKDRQYTMPKESLARRSAQTAMYHVLQALVRWIAPILSFTAEEIWRYIPSEKSDSIFLTTWYENLAPLSDAELMNQEYWQQLIQIRAEVNKELEKERAEGKIGSALGAEVTLYCDERLQKELALLENELRFVFITASAKVKPLTDKSANSVATAMENLWINVTPSTNKKCIRCWHYREDVGKNPEHPDICLRCVENISTKGETRKYA